jgi:uracil-DNA glycosylase
MGLSFSVPQGVRVPPSLKNIYKEINDDIGCPIPDHGDLSSWASQGVLLLNAILTVEEKSPASHSKIGWQTFTDAIITFISDVKEGVIFMLWGKYAQGKASLVNDKKHYILNAAHPSPLARGAFFGCKHFSKCNNLLDKQGKQSINWTL